MRNFIEEFQQSKQAGDWYQAERLYNELCDQLNISIEGGEIGGHLAEKRNLQAKNEGEIRGKKIV